jgi:hypothetical protein
MILLLIVAYLLFGFSGWLAVVKFFTHPHFEQNLTNKSYRQVSGHDLSWCECIAFAIIALIPVSNISMNTFWFWVWRQHIKRRPLIKWPRFKFPKCKLPKCPVAIRKVQVQSMHD